MEVTHSKEYAALSSIRKRATFIGILLLIALVCIDLSIGSSHLTPLQAVLGLLGCSDTFSNSIMQTVRLPHVLCAAIAGAGLSLAGCAYQGTLNNPLASPSTTGVSQGAAFGAACGILITNTTSIASETLTFNNPGVVALCAFLGAMLSTLTVLALTRHKSLSPESVVLAGVALGALFAGATALIQYFADDSKISAIVFWTFGSVRKAGYTEISIMTIVIMLCAFVFYRNRWGLNALESGDANAHNLGLNPKNLRLKILLVATLCASISIAFCGTINFIGLLAPHIMRRFIGGDYRFLLPTSAIAGASIMVFSDILSSVILSGTILPISSITSFVGAPFFIYLLFRKAAK